MRARLPASVAGALFVWQRAVVSPRARRSLIEKSREVRNSCGGVRVGDTLRPRSSTLRLRSPMTRTAARR